MKSRSFWKSFLALQAVAVIGVGSAYLLASPTTRIVMRETLGPGRAFVPVEIRRDEPIEILRPYNRPDWVSDEDLAMVLSQVQPRFHRENMKPNFVEHALRTWGVDATFQNPNSVSGADMLSFLTDNASFMNSWGDKIKPILQEHPTGIGIRWGTELCASYHHDHLLACVTEAGARLSTPVYGPTRQHATLENVIQESLRDFRLDERETEWTAMAFGLWIAPQKSWVGGDGRQYSFDLIVHRLLRGEKTQGVCAGTHRVYSLLLLVLLDDQHDILSDESRELAMQYLRETRDLIIESQFEDGHWASNWPAGRDSVENPIDEPDYRAVIATGHHLEWMSIAPQELHIPDAQIKKAIDWVIANTRSQSLEGINTRYTFYSHVGAALANWRQVRPADYWREWESQHPFDPDSEPLLELKPVSELSESLTVGSDP